MTLSVTIIISYLFGAIPFGWLFSWLFFHIDIRKIGSGRTGTTNTMRAGGYPVAILTMIFDVSKGFFAVWLAKMLVPGNNWVEIFAPLAGIIGHNYSIFLIEKREDGKIQFGGGAGGAPAFGGALGLWLPSFWYLIIVGLIAFFGIGYASVTTMSIGFTIMIIFALRAWMNLSPWSYFIYGFIAEILLVWALRPNIQRLINGNERGVSWRAYSKRK
ncbi:glycerol-3-phosphate acyltransferase [Flexilinea flocculi]|uniref:Glycerol-3-phosphate acyltransferase n=1 Tax=Flexilinea flocculi TaxID=1678840 RepID=A0A0S7BU36_9CHLR|nr:glycerol-3-phosphate acyltransferase [Flexilinea flocculi]GAP40281.1 phospholipid biosynthesis protein PlsY [Flexilinea flocculi]